MSSISSVMTERKENISHILKTGRRRKARYHTTTLQYHEQLIILVVSLHLNTTQKRLFSVKLRYLR